MTDISRRTLVKGSVLAAALAAAPTAAQATAAGPRQSPAGIALVRNRLSLPSGIATGDVTSDSAVLWSRASGAGRMTAVLPNITSVAAVGIIFTLLFARDFGLVNWLLGFVGVEPIAWQDHRWSSWLAISVMVDWRWTGYNALIFLAALQAVPKDLYEAAAIDGASKWRQFWSISVPLLRPTIVFVTLISTIGGIQLFTEPLLFNSGANAITGGTTRQFQTLTMYLYEKAFTGLDFGYAAAIAWGMFVVIAIVGAINALLLRRLRSVD